MRFQARRSDFKAAARRARDLHRARRREAARIATDRASKAAQIALQSKMKSVGLKRLSNAVGQTSALRKKQLNTDPYGVIFARGGDESRAGGALEIYSRGGSIKPVKRRWLWFSTPRIQKRFGRYKTTPERYQAAGSPLGPLQFAVLSPRRAIAYVEKVAISVKTGLARPAPKRKSKTTVPAQRVILFIGIPITRRAQRFDKNVVVAREAARMPVYLAQAENELARAGR